MSATQGHAIDAIAFQLVAALEAYEEDCERLIKTWLDMGLYQSVRRQADHMQMLCASLVQLSVPWVGLLIAHAELIHGLWKCGETCYPSAELAACRARHTQAIQALRTKCIELFRTTT